MLPRLLYLGRSGRIELSRLDAAVSLLQRYPAERWRIVEGTCSRPAPIDGRRRDQRHAAGWPFRLLNTRPHLYSRWLLMGARRRAAITRGLIGNFSPEAVLTVGHGYSWLTAAQFAGDANLPLHLILHDDWPRIVAPSLRPSVDRAFGEVYCQATSRLCASPFMCEDYARRYGLDRTVLLPYRAADAPVFGGVAERCSARMARRCLRLPERSIAGLREAVRALAAGIAKHNGELLIFGPIA